MISFVFVATNGKTWTRKTSSTNTFTQCNVGKQSIQHKKESENLLLGLVIKFNLPTETSMIGVSFEF